MKHEKKIQPNPKFYTFKEFNSPSLSIFLRFCSLERNERGKTTSSCSWTDRRPRQLVKLSEQNFCSGFIWNHCHLLNASHFLRPYKIDDNRFNRPSLIRNWQNRNESVFLHIFLALSWIWNLFNLCSCYYFWVIIFFQLQFFFKLEKKISWTE